MRTPRDNFALNQDGSTQLVGAAPKDLKRAELARRSQLKSQFAALPKPKELDFELQLDDEEAEMDGGVEMSEEDAAERDRRNRALQEAAEKADFKRRTQVMQRNLPRPMVVSVDALLKAASEVSDPIEAMIAKEKALLIANDSIKYPLPGAKTQGSSKPLQSFDDEDLSIARLEIAKELPQTDRGRQAEEFEEAYTALHPFSSLPGLSDYNDEDSASEQALTEAFDSVQSQIMAAAERGNALESKLNLHLGGYQKRAKTLRQKIVEAAEALEEEKRKLETFTNLQVAEDAALTRRTESLREEVEAVKNREKEGQELYRQALEEARGAGRGLPNGDHA